MTTKNQTTTTAIAVHQPMPVSTMADLKVAGDLLAQSGMFDLNPASGFVVAATCHQQGISLMEFHRTYHIVEGKPSMRADAMLAEFRKRGGKYTITSNTVDQAAATFEFEGREYPASYTMADAQRTGDCFKGDGKTVKNVWQKRPDDMLWARMISRAVRRLCPEINAGLYTSEEVADFDHSKGDDGPPVVISPAEAADRAKPVEAELVDPIEAVDCDTTMPDTADYTVSPIGGEGVKGKPWSDFTDAELAKAATIEHDAMTHTHIGAVRFEIDKRKGGE